MSGNVSRKYKQYRLMQERRDLFGDVSAKDDFGRVDLVAFGASQGRVIISVRGQTPYKNWNSFCC